MIELFINLKTQSEKIFLITKLKKTHDLNLLSKIANLKIKQLILNILETNPNKRPSLNDILQQFLIEQS